MKNTLIILSLFFSTLSFSQTTSTVTVKGNCEECKERIEKAAKIKGVKKAEWDKKTKIATITYDETKTNLNTIEKAIAKRGYETTNVKADNKAYSKLPDCCKYNDGECEEE